MLKMDSLLFTTIMIAVLSTTIVFGSTYTYEKAGNWADTSKLGPYLLRGTELIETNKALENVHTVALYFSAHWCPPCRQFTPDLARIYNQSWRRQGIEIIFVSADSDEDQFNEYFKEMPWLSIPYAQAVQVRDVNFGKYTQGKGIPNLLLLDGILLDGKTEQKLPIPDGRQFAYENQNSIFTLNIRDLKNNPEWNGRQCSVYTEMGTQKLISNVPVPIKPENLKAINGNENLEVGQDVIVHGLVKVPAFNTKEGRIVQEKNSEGRYTVKFEIYIPAKNLSFLKNF